MAIFSASVQGRARGTRKLIAEESWSRTDLTCRLPSDLSSSRWMNRQPEAQGLQLPSLRGRGDTHIHALHVMNASDERQNAAERGLAKPAKRATMPVSMTARHGFELVIVPRTLRKAKALLRIRKRRVLQSPSQGSLYQELLMLLLLLLLPQRPMDCLAQTTIFSLPRGF